MDPDKLRFSGDSTIPEVDRISVLVLTIFVEDFPEFSSLQVQELFECNVRLSGSETDASRSQVTAQSDKEVRESRRSDTHHGDTMNSNTSDNKKNTQVRTSESTNCDSVGEHDTPAKLSDLKLEPQVSSNNETKASDDVCNDTEVPVGQAETDCNKNKANTKSSSSKELAAVGGEDGKASKKSGESSAGIGVKAKETVALATGNRKAKDLCQTTCRLLKEQIMKVHEDLDRQWQVLRHADVLVYVLFFFPWYRRTSHGRPRFWERPSGWQWVVIAQDRYPLHVLYCII